VLPLVLVVALALVQTGLLVRDRLLVEAAARAGARGSLSPLRRWEVKRDLLASPQF
jgi:TadE-like protein